jgi:hypothetical protein
MVCRGKCDESLDISDDVYLVLEADITAYGNRVIDDYSGYFDLTSLYFDGTLTIYFGEHGSLVLSVDYLEKEEKELLLELFHIDYEDYEWDFDDGF